MIIYDATKKDFMDHVTNDEIVTKIYDAYKQRIGCTSKNEIQAWNNSMLHMYKVLNTNEIPNNCGVAIEYKVPSTSKRIDFILTGYNEKGNGQAVIIELKQWQKVELVEGKSGLVRTALNHGMRETTHPSYQAWTYAYLLNDYNETVQTNHISLTPCAYLHNYHLNENDPLINPVFDDVLSKAPVYTQGEVIKLRKFLTNHIKKADWRKVLYEIDGGKIRPSKSLQDSLLNMLKGNQEFVMIDDQKTVYETAVNLAKRSYKTGQKNVLIVEGGPGTGKSVLAINLLVELTARDMIVQYVTKNSAPRNVYSKRLQQGYSGAYIKNLFKGSGSFYDCETNEFDVLIVDEAHRLNEKSGLFSNLGENQMKEIINATKLSVFFIDEFQRISLSDVGTKDDIVKFAEQSGANIEIMKLESQFRCNGSDGYLAWLDDVLEIRETANFDGFDFGYDFMVVDDPSTLRNDIFDKNKLNNKARIVAGYCWEWLKDGRAKPEVHDIVIDDFAMSWNLDNSSTWAIDESSVNEAGCIHTAQGLEFDYIGVIIGNDLRYEDGHIFTDYTKRAKSDQSLKGLKKILKEDKNKGLEIADQIIKNTYRTLMTRGQKGCYVYCQDEALRNYLKARMKGFNKNITYDDIQSGCSIVAEENMGGIKKD